MSSAAPSRPGPLRRDQVRALEAYKWAQRAKDGHHLDDYTTAVQTFAANMLRGGLAVAVSVLERSGDRTGVNQLLRDLACYQHPNEPDRPKKWPGIIREMADTGHYMRTTREFIALTAWLQRACRALEEPPKPSGEEAIS